MNTKTFFHKTATTLLIALMLFAALPVPPAGAVSLDITSVASGTWEATAWPNTLRSGTITVTAGNTTVAGTGTGFLTELSVGNIIKTASDIQIGTVASIASNTSLTLANTPTTTRTNIPYHVQGVGPADNVTIANGHNVMVAAKAIHQTGTVTINSGGTLTVSNPGAIFSTLSVNGTLNGLTGHALGALTVNNGGLLSADGSSGAYTASSLTVSSGGTANITRNFTVNGTTSISGTINFSSNSITGRAMVFTGPVTLNGGATWSESTSGNGVNNTYTFQDNFTNNAGAFTASATSTHTFSGAGKTLSGTTTTAIARVAIPGTYTNNGTLTVGTNLFGAGTLTNTASGTLSVGGSVSLAVLANAGTATKTGAGPISTTLANFTNTGTLNLNGTGTIRGITNNAAGTVNLNSSGLIYAFDNATATSTLNIFALSVPHFHSLVVGTPGNTVNYGGAGNQTVKPITYSNLTFSGSGNKSITMTSGHTMANGTLSIAPTGTAKASITGNNLSVNHLSLAGVDQVPGTWGSSSSAAVNQDDTFFAPTTGYVNVVNDSKLSQSITFTSAPPEDAIVSGPTYTPTATASSGLPVTFTIDPSAATVCQINAGVVSFIGTGTCEIDADQAGDGTYLAASQQQSFDVKSAQTINFTSTPPTNAVVGGATYTPTATASSGLPVTFTIDASAASICSINAGVVSFEAAGTCVINADQAGDNDYHPAPQVQQSFLVKSGATVNVSIGGQLMTSGCTPSNSPYTVAVGASMRVTCASVNSGPVKIESDVNFIAAERVIYKVSNVNTSFSEIMGLPNSQLDNIYWLPWYNSKSLNTQLRFANLGGADATIHVSIGGAPVPGSPFTLAAGASTRKSFPNIDKGPVKIESNMNIIAAERVIYRVNGVDTSFSEMMAMPESQLDTVYWLPWYNSKSLDTQLRIANVSDSTATVDVSIGATPVTGSPFTIPAGGSIRRNFPNIDKGPVKIESNVDVLASERVIYKVNGVQTSFSEMMALPDSQKDTIFWMPWYNSKSLNTQLRIANVSGSTATVDISIGGTPVTGSPFTVPVGGSIRKNFANIDKGPVKIESNVDIIAAERVIYTVNNVATSFSELMGLPNGLLDTIYWFPWYNSQGLDTQLRFGIP